jgi:hypothetical protein
MAHAVVAHGDGHVILTHDGLLITIVGGVITSSDRPLSRSYRDVLEDLFDVLPPVKGVITSRQIKMAMRVPYDEESDDDDCTLGSEDTWSDDEDYDYEEEV